MKTKPTSLLTYVLAIECVTIAALFLLPVGQLETDPASLLLLVTLAAAVGARPIRIPALRMEVMAGDAFIFTALAALGGLPAVIVAASSTLGAVVARRPRPDVIRVVFNLSTMILSAATGYLVLAATGGGAGHGLVRQILPLVAATTVYFVINTSLVTGAIAIERKAPFFGTWRRSGLWTAVSNYSGLTLAACLIVLLDAIGPWGLALGIPPCWLLVSFYRTHKERLEEQQRRLDQVVDHNVELEVKVKERTTELQRAVTHIEETNRELRLTNDRLTEANRAKSAFLANVSHELRTPLNAIIGFSELLTDASFGKLNDEQRDFAKDINESGVHLLRLINDILDLSKIEAGKIELHREAIDVDTALQEASSMLRPQVAKKGVTLSVSCDEAIEGAEVDPGMFRQIALNLLSNAVKFTPAGGRVDLDARRDREDLLIEVRDTGIGIAEQDQKKVFDEFYQVDGSYSRNYQGTGLGLALVRRLIQLHGGRIALRSELGRGSTFTVTFPSCLVEKSPNEREPEIAPSLREESTGHTILVVEDNPVNMKLVRNVLRSRGFTTLTATSGEEALDLLRGTTCDLILMDIQLPGVDGLEVTRRLKTDPSTAAIPVVALSAHAQLADQERATKAGCVGYITKPIRLNRFPAQIREFLGAEEKVA